MAVSKDERPAVAVGHIHLNVANVDAELEFFIKHGMRKLLQRADFGILELRGGTHLIVRKTDESVATGTRTPFDLMVDDIDSTHSQFVTDNRNPTDIERGNIHDSFSVTSPSGYVVPITSSHVAGPV